MTFVLIAQYKYSTAITTTLRVHLVSVIVSLSTRECGYAVAYG